MQTYSLQFPDCPSISFAEVAAMQATNSDIAVVLVDVRTKEVNPYLITLFYNTFLTSHRIYISLLSSIIHS